MNRRMFLKHSGSALAGLSLAGWLSSAAAVDAEETAVLPQEAALPYTLPPLPYAYEALEPHIDAETMRLHHDIHFAGYTRGLNKALSELETARSTGDYTLIQHWENQLAFNGAGYVLHTVFFQNMTASGSSRPSEPLQRRLGEHFGSFDAFKAHFSKAAATVQGSGWGLLGFQPLGQRLIVLQAEMHQNLTQWSVIPLLAIDVWEHAYYLKYQNRRSEYIENWWQVVNWQQVEERLERVLSEAAALI